MIDVEPWFVAADVCKALEIKNPRDTLKKRLDEDEKGVASIYTLGGDQNMAIVNESGLYSLILRSRKPEAKIILYICDGPSPSHPFCRGCESILCFFVDRWCSELYTWSEPGKTYGPLRCESAAE